MRRFRSTALLAVAGVAVAVAVLGPALVPGALVNLDLVVFDRIDVPHALWGLGVELPRAVLLWTGLGVADEVVGSHAATAGLLALLVVLTFVGAARLVPERALPERLLTGGLYALSPFLLTRVGVGHLGVVAAMAVLPWALPTLLAPGRSPSRTLLWCTAMGLSGLVGGAYAGIAVAVGLVAERGRRSGAVTAAYLAGQLPWLVPAIVAWTVGTASPAGAARFGTETSGPLGPLELLAGDGFWRTSNQVGIDPSWLLGLALGGLAAVGWASLPAWRRRAAVVGGIGYAIAATSAVPGIRSLHAAFADTAVGAPFRESHRYLGLTLVILAPAAAAGIRTLVERDPGIRALTCAVAVGLVVFPASGGLWGVGGQLRTVDPPSGWSDARNLIHDAPGTTLGLPWHRYLDLDFAGGRRTLHPLPALLGGDVIVSSDPELDEPSRERTDPREGAAAALVGDGAGPGEIGPALADLGVRWVVLLHEADWERWEALHADRSLEVVLATGNIDVFAVRAWRGPFVTPDGTTFRADRPFAPWVRLPSSEAARWQEPFASGWIRGTERVRRSEHGLIDLPPGSRTLWFWPVTLVLLADAISATAVAVALRAIRRERRRLRSPTDQPRSARPSALRAGV